jgi:hypothetical protein
MKVIIAGTRRIRSYGTVERAVIASGYDVTEVVCGGAIGVDLLGKKWAKINKVRVKTFLPNWDKYGERAGFIRNRKVAKYSDALIAVWDGKSGGTKDMIECMEIVGKKVFIYP